MGIVAENIILRKQISILFRSKTRCPPLRTRDRIVMAICTYFLSSRRLDMSCIAVTKATVLRFHRALVRKKYSILFGCKGKRRPGRPGPSKDLIRFIVELKEKNPGYGCPKIADLASNVLGRKIDDETVRRILKNYWKPSPGSGPSWLTPIGNKPGKLWSLDFFHLESGLLSTYWAMVVMDQCTRRIVGFAVHRGTLDGHAACCMFNSIINGKSTPRYLSTDNDPLFRFCLWKSNLEFFDIEELKTVRNCPWSHPFVERLIGSVRREFTDRMIFWTRADLEAKFFLYTKYFNEFRVHQAHGGRTPQEFSEKRSLASIELDHYRWKPVCGGLFHTPIAA